MRFNDFAAMRRSRHRRFRGFSFGDDDDGTDGEPTTGVPLMLALPQPVDYTSTITNTSQLTSSSTSSPSLLQQGLSIVQGLFSPKPATPSAAVAAAGPSSGLIIGGALVLGVGAFLLLKK